MMKSVSNDEKLKFFHITLLCDRLVYHKEEVYANMITSSSQQKSEISFILEVKFNFIVAHKNAHTHTQTNTYMHMHTHTCTSKDNF